MPPLSLIDVDVHQAAPPAADSIDFNAPRIRSARVRVTVALQTDDRNRP